MAKNNEMVTLLGEQQPEEDKIGPAGRIGMSALQGLESPFTAATSLADLLMQATGQPTIPTPSPTEILQEQLGITPEQLEPKSGLERFGQRAAKFAPLSGLTGGLSGLASTTAAAIPATAAGEEGYPEWAQDLIQLGTEGAIGFLGGRIPTIKETKNQEDKMMRASVANVKENRIEPIKDALKNAREELVTEVRPEMATKMDKVFKRIDKNLKGKKINPAQAADVKSSLNSLYRDLPKPDAEKHVRPLINGFDTFFAGYAAKNPSFFKSLKARDQLTTVEHMQSQIADYAAKKIPGVGKILGDFLEYSLGKGEKFFRSIISQPAARKYYLNAVESIGENNPTLVTHYITKLMDRLGAPKPEKDESEMVELL